MKNDEIEYYSRLVGAKVDEVLLPLSGLNTEDVSLSDMVCIIFASWWKALDVEIIYSKITEDECHQIISMYYPILKQNLSKLNAFELGLLGWCVSVTEWFFDEEVEYGRNLIEKAKDMDPGNYVLKSMNIFYKSFSSYLETNNITRKDWDKQLEACCEVVQLYFGSDYWGQEG